MPGRSSLPLPRRLAYAAWKRVPGAVRELGETGLRLRAERVVRGQPWFDGGSPHRLLVGPLNTAGQGAAWARAADELPGVVALSLSAARRSAAASAYGYASDVHLDLPAQLRGLRAHRERVLGTGRPPGATAVLAESGLPVLGPFWDRTILEDLPELEAAGIRVALLLHGSELRDLHRHADAYPHSPFRGAWDERWDRMQATVERTRAIVEAFPGTVLVSTPDLLEDLPSATWLPVVVDVDRFATAAAASGVLPMERARPVVLHAPSNPRLKGTEAVEQVLQGMESAGLVEYRRLSGVPHARMAAVVAAADVVVDQMVLGNPGVAMTEALAAGRVVVAHLSDGVRAGWGDEPPVVEADPGTLEEVLRDVLARREHYTALAAGGPAWARRHHDGRRSAAVLEKTVLR